MLKKISLVVFLFLWFVLTNAIGETQESYINNEWGFRVSIPKGWYVTEASTILQSLESQQNISSEALTAIKNSGLVINISEYPFASKVGFNPNLNISAKNISIEPKPSSDKEILNFAKQILSSMFTGREHGFQEVSINGFVGINSSYKYLTKDNVEIKNEIVILIDKDKNNYFIATFGYKDKEYIDIFKRCIESFNKL